jgi:hypothetical protein
MIIRAQVKMELADILLFEEKIQSGINYYSRLRWI